MRVLQANKFFYLRGGSERYFLDLLDLLPRRGHETAPFSMSDPQNDPSPYERFFVSGMDYGPHRGGAALATAVRTVYRRETRTRVGALLREFRPRVAHLHNIHHQLTGSLYESLSDAGVPVVQTLHDFQWVCPVYTFLSRGRICERCGHGRYFPAVRRRCQDGSLARSAVAALALKVGEWRGWRERVVRFLAPSEFMAATVVEHGLPRERVQTLGYCLDLDRYRPGSARGEHILYAGRLAPEKGVETLLRAAGRVSGLRLRVAGTGPLEGALRSAAEENAPGRVEFLGHLEPARLRKELGEASLVVVPSEWFENQPYAILEAFAMETPVLGARIGGIPELVRPGETGQLFESGSVDSLAEALGRLAASPRLREMGREARELVRERFDPQRHLDELLAVYEGVAG